MIEEETLNLLQTKYFPGSITEPTDYSENLNELVRHGNQGGLGTSKTNSHHNQGCMDCEFVRTI